MNAEITRTIVASIQLATTPLAHLTVVVILDILATVVFAKVQEDKGDKGREREEEGGGREQWRME